MTACTFTLYHYPLTRSVRAKWLLHEILGEDFDDRVTVRRVELLRGEQYGAEFLARNPNHAVPVLEVEAGAETFRMIESGAIVSYLADAFPERHLAPPPTFSAARADYLQVLHFGSSSVDMMLWQLRLHRDLLPADERDPATENRYRQKFLDQVEPQLKERLADGGFACGNAFTAADCVTGHNVNWARAYGLCAGEVFDAYLQRLEARPGYVAAFADRAEFGR